MVQLVQKDQVTKSSAQIQTPFQLLKIYFSFLHCSQKYIFLPSNQIWLKKLQQEKYSKMSSKQSFLTFLICCAIKLRSCILKHHHRFAKFHMHYVCGKQKHTLPICNKFCFLLLKKLVLHQQNSYVFPTEQIVQMLKIGFNISPKNNSNTPWAN